MYRRRRAARTVALMSLFNMTDIQENVPVASFIGDGSDLVSLIIGIEPAQDLHGYDNPWPAGGGKNTYPNSSISGSVDGVTITHNVDDESYKVSGLSEAYRGFLATSSFTLKAGTYTLSRTASSETVSANSLRMEIRSTDGLTIYASTAGIPTFTLAGDTEVKARIVVGQSGVDFGTGITYRFQIEAGSSPTSWTPYSNICPISGWTGANIHVSPTTDAADGTTYSITFPSSAGTVYGGTLDATTGKLTVDRKMVDMGTLTWTSVSSSRKQCAELANSIAKPSSTAVKGNLIAERYANVNASDLFSDSLLIGIAVNISGYLIARTNGEDVSGKLVYELATPIVYDLTPTEVTTLLGTNNIWADTGDIKYIEYNI